MNRIALFRSALTPAASAKASSAMLGLGLLCGLAGCADSGQSPTMPATEEAQIYRSHARSHYYEPGPPEDPWRPYIQEATRRFDVPEAWVRAVIHQESGVFGQYALSAPGAMGLMQVMPFTYDEMRTQYGLGEDAYDPHDNIMAGTAYLRQMYDLYGTPGFLAAYNAGPGRLDAFLTRDKPLPAETRHYVALIGPHIAGVYPKSRSQADLMATAAHNGDATYAANAMPVLTNAATQSVKLAWAKRTDGSGDSSQPVQVAEAPIAAEPAPQYGSAWRKVSSADQSASDAATPRDAVAAAWAQRQGNTTPQPATIAAATPAAAPAPPPASSGQVQGVLMADNTVHATDASADSDDDAQPAQPRPQVRLASAETLRPARQHYLAVAPAHGEWAIQVGAFGSQRQASAAAGAARSRAGLDGGHAEVAGLHKGRVELYRARITGLSREAATRACAKMKAGACVVVSPDAG